MAGSSVLAASADVRQWELRWRAAAWMTASLLFGCRGLPPEGAAVLPANTAAAGETLYSLASKTARRNPEKAAGLCRTGVEQYPGEPRFLLLLGTLDVRLGDLYHGGEAVRVLEQYSRLRPTDPEGWLRLALARDQSSQPEAALQAMTRHIQLDPRDARAYAWRARLLFESGKDPSSVAADAQRSLRLDPSSAMAHAMLGRAEFAGGAAAAGVQEFSKALKLTADPLERRFILHARGQAENQLGRRAAAARDLQEAARLTRTQMEQIQHGSSQ